MTRRNVIQAILGAFALDPERALWVKGQKTISIPKPILPTLLYDSYVEHNSWNLVQLPYRNLRYELRGSGIRIWMDGKTVHDPSAPSLGVGRFGGDILFMSEVGEHRRVRFQ